MSYEKQPGTIEQIPIKVTIERDQPLDIATFSKALLSLNNAVDEYVSLSSGTSGIKATLNGVEKGSDIIYILITGAVMFDTLLPTINGYFEFFNNIKNIGKKSVDDIKEDRFLTSTALDDMENIINLANQSGVSVTINYNNYKDCMIINQENKESYAKGVATARQIKDFESKEQRYFENVLIRMKEVKDSERIVKDKAICDDIIPGKAVSTEIVDKDAKELINKNPFDNYYLVNLSVHKANGVVKLYRITALHSIIPKTKD
ncbi:hypothetical protein CMCT_0805 [Campylobacter mucosalis]|uniref:hypothetical protein n=1 Tax=Campylobacter mucosalis TaxID=202 RepID=UPI0015946FAB|nr:hypothetical protein [Campylobacter mucosalis]QKF62944.1 hypothetical protein CMCT_0805 [Campylobacter mucosalis]